MVVAAGFTLAAFVRLPDSAILLEVFRPEPN